MSGPRRRQPRRHQRFARVRRAGEQLRWDSKRRRRYLRPHSERDPRSRERRRSSRQRGSRGGVGKLDQGRETHWRQQQGAQAARPRRRPARRSACRGCTSASRTAPNSVGSISAAAVAPHPQHPGTALGWFASRRASIRLAPQLQAGPSAHRAAPRRSRIPRGSPRSPAPPRRPQPTPRPTAPGPRSPSSQIGSRPEGYGVHCPGDELPLPLTAAVRARGVEARSRTWRGSSRWCRTGVRTGSARPRSSTCSTPSSWSSTRAGRCWRSSPRPGLGGRRRLRRLVDRADRLPEVRGLDAAVGDPRPRRRLDAAQLPLPAADRRPALLAAAGDGAAAAVARTRCR